MVIKMEEKKEEILYAINIKEVLTYAIFGIIIGGVLSLIPFNYISQTIILMVAFTLLIVSGVRVYRDLSNHGESTNDTLVDVLGVLCGFLLLIIDNDILNIVIASLLMAEPIVEIIVKKFSKDAIIVGLPRISLGLILLFGKLKIVATGFKIIGIVLLIASLIYLGVNYYLYKKSKVKIIEK